MRSLILNFLLLVLYILRNFDQDIYYKYSKFSKTLTKKSFKFILSRGNDILAFNLSFVLLTAEVNLITEKQNYKRDIFETYGISRIEIIFALSVKKIALYI